jgi:predicted RNA binding protein YcfA (HicA-like mRNA interferase family)
MTKLPVISGQECVRALEKAGFDVRRQRGSHIIMQRKSPFAQVSVPNHKTLKTGTLRKIIKDAGLTVDEFVDLL